MDSTELTVPQSTDPLPPQAAHPLRKTGFAICLWGALIVSAFLIGWCGARFTRARNLPSSTTSAADSQATPPAATADPQGASMTLLTRSLSVEDLDGISDQLDDPRWDDRQKQAADSKAPQDVPESQRWQINFPSGTTEVEYGRQLSALGVELGVVRADGMVEYLANPGEAEPKHRTAPRAEEKRIYWTWSKGNLVKADKALLKNAGIDAGDDIILHLWPPATVEKLNKLEQEYKGRQPKDIFLTRFAVKRTFRGYEVFVEEQVGR
jgi:hypothetical protein